MPNSSFNFHPFPISPGFLSLFLLSLFACETQETDPLQKALNSAHPAIAKVMAHPNTYEVQILYTEIDSTAHNGLQFDDYSYALNTQQYFYPASTVKLPIAVLALEKLQQHPQLNANTPYTIGRDTLPHTINDDIRQIFAVSDNEAYNRLYEFLGRDYINSTLKDKGISPVRITHRLSTSNAAYGEHLPLQFVSAVDTIVINGSPSKAPQPLTISATKKGVGFIKNDTLISQAMDFSVKNYFPLVAQHELMKRLFFHSKYSKDEQFHLSEEHQNLLFRHMHAKPRENGYDESTYYDSYGKFFLYGDTKERIPDPIKIYNKVGYAYGTLTETAYIVDQKNHIQFLLSATILVNENGIFNDDTYEFDTIGIPFLAQLGRELYDLQLDVR